MSGKETRGRRGDIQGLRAVAILTVVIYHSNPSALPGGFVGVDVFFVISGFLIAGILVRQQVSTGTISLPSFWARRVRRLMPATLVVTIATLLVASLRLDPISLVRTFDNAAWSLLSLANIHFASSPTGGYFANQVINPFLHFWSLSVEEQFYIVLPLLLLLVGLIRRRWAVPALIGAVFLVSLAASIFLSAENDPNAFYSLGTRAWELAIGAMLAWFTSMVRTNPPRWARAAAFVLGIVAIAAAAVGFNAGMPWPSYSALLPTVGAALVIWSGTGGSAGWVTRILDNPVAKYIGDVSFSLYLWHWPILVLAPAALAGHPTLQQFPVLIAFGLAVLTYHFVEQPFQRVRESTRPWRVLALGLPVTAALSVAAFLGAGIAMPNSGVQAAALPAQYQTLSDGPGSTPSAVPDNVKPSLLDVGYDLQQVYKECYGPGLPICWAGDPQGKKTLLVTGDSYAGMFWPSIDQAAKDHGWRLVIVSRAGCALLDPVPLMPTDSQYSIDCNQWQGRALAKAAELDPDLILFINSMPIDDGGQGFSDWVSGTEAAAERLHAVAPLVFLGPTPRFPWAAEQCLAANFSNPSACSRTLEEAVPPSLRAAGAQIAKSSGASLLDLNGILCNKETCPMIADDTIMYRDSGHISNAYSTHFAAVFGDALARYFDG